MCLRPPDAQRVRLGFESAPYQLDILRDSFAPASVRYLEMRGFTALRS